MPNSCFPNKPRKIFTHLNLYIFSPWLLIVLTFLSSVSSLLHNRRLRSSKLEAEVLADQIRENPGLELAVVDHGGSWGRSEENVNLVTLEPTLSSFNVTQEMQSKSSLGPMIKEKDWSRTLECKLFEERNRANGGGGERMDLLWEAYERTEENRGEQSTTSNEKKKMNKKKSRIVDFLEDFDDEEVEEGQQLCCLKALNLSAGKVNFGMNKPGFLNISRAFKGVGVGLMNNYRKQQRKKGF